MNSKQRSLIYRKLCGWFPEIRKAAQWYYFIKQYFLKKIENGHWIIKPKAIYLYNHIPKKGGYLKHFEANCTVTVFHKYLFGNNFSTE